MKKESPFEFTKMVLKSAGIMKAEGRYRWVYWLCEGAMSLSLSWVWIPLGLAVARDSGLDYSDLIFALVCMVGYFHIGSKFLVLRWRAPRVLAMIRTLEGLTERAIDSYPEEAPVFARATRFANLIPQVHISSVITLIVLYLGVGLYTRVQPFPTIWIPLESFENTCVLQTFTSLSPTFALAAPYALLSALAVNTATHASFLCKRLADLPRSKDFTTDLRRCVHLHKSIISLVGDINSTFSDLLLQEILLSSVQCCLVGYMCSQGMKGMPEGNKVACSGFVFTALLPFIICLCGEIIKDASSKITFAAYSSPWYAQPIQNKKRIRLMMTVANRHLTLHYKNFVTFDMLQYSLVLQAAYSYFTVLESLDIHRVS